MLWSVCFSIFDKNHIETGDFLPIAFIAYSFYMLMQAMPIGNIGNANSCIVLPIIL